MHWNAFKPRASLRTLEFAPDCFNEDHFHIVRHVVIARSNALNKPTVSTVPSGRFLVYEPALGMYDCLAEGESDGFFDSNDCPPWDLWVGFIRDDRSCSRYVLSWIPDYLLDVVQSGIDATSGGSLYWLNHADEAWAKGLLRDVDVG